MRSGRIFRSGVVRCIRVEGSTFDQDLSVTERVGGRGGGGGSAEGRSGWREVVDWGRVKRGERGRPGDVYETRKFSKGWLNQIRRKAVSQGRPSKGRDQPCREWTTSYLTEGSLAPFACAISLERYSHSLLPTASRPDDRALIVPFFTPPSVLFVQPFLSSSFRFGRPSGRRGRVDRQGPDDRSWVVRERLFWKFGRKGGSEGRWGRVEHLFERGGGQLRCYKVFAQTQRQDEVSFLDQGTKEADY